MKPGSNWLEAHARFRPDAEAVADLGTGRRWTWAELYQDSLRWAGTLRGEGVVAGDRVAVLARNRGETLALLFACAELGAILLPLNWRLSLAELRVQLAQARPRVVYADADHKGLDGARALEAGPGAAPFRGEGGDPDSPWVMLYTSGSTGRPRGALLTHRQIQVNAVNTLLACGLSPTDSTLTFAPLFHTGGLNCLSTPLLHAGGRVVLQPGLDPGAALRAVAQERITLLMGVPTIYALLADHPEFATADLSSVRDALCGGAPLPLPLLDRWLARGIPLRQGFGLTEVGPNCFSLPPADIRRKRGSVGKPIHHLEARLLRPDGSACADGEPGELVLRGPVVFAGYFEDEAATAAVLRNGWFHTGDVLVRDEEGYYAVIGRLKEMYISGGENVFPAEVEAALVEIPGVAEAAVVGVPDDRWGEVGAAFLVLQPGAALTGEAVRDALGSRLARYKLPKRYIVLPTLPRTASGKVDKPLLSRLESP